jgi:hypothetical protein
VGKKDRLRCCGRDRSRRLSIQHNRHECRRRLTADGRRQGKVPRPRQTPPVVDLLRPASMALRDLRHHRIRRQALQDNARLQLVGPATPAGRAGEQLHAPRRMPWVVRSVVSLEHCPLHGIVRKRSPLAPLLSIQGPRGNAYHRSGGADGTSIRSPGWPMSSPASAKSHKAGCRNCCPGSGRRCAYQRQPDHRHAVASSPAALSVCLQRSSMQLRCSLFRACPKHLLK